MNALQRAKASMHELVDVLRHAGQARMAFEARRREPLAPPRATRVEIRGMGMIRICDADTGQTLAMRQSYTEALGVAKALERGEALQVAQ